MKHTIPFILTALMAASCLNYEGYEPQKKTALVPVRFTLEAPQTGALTKASDETLQAAVDAVTTYGTAPITLTRTDDATKVYTATPGTEVYLPVGTYTATADINGTQHTTSPLGTVYTTPCATVTQTVEVTTQTTTIPLTSTPTCYALILDRKTTRAFRIRYDNMVDALPIFPDGGDLAVVFVKPSTQIAGCTAGLIPQSATGSEREYTVSWLTGQGGTHLDAGCWYCFTAPATIVTAGVSVTHGTFARGYNDNE